MDVLPLRIAYEREVVLHRYVEEGQPDWSRVGRLLRGRQTSR